MTMSHMAKKDILVKFGQHLRELRQEACWSQEAFAEQCEMDRTYIDGIERGERNVALRNFERIAAAL